MFYCIYVKKYFFYKKNSFSFKINVTKPFFEIKNTIRKSISKSFNLNISISNTYFIFLNLKCSPYDYDDDHHQHKSNYPTDRCNRNYCDISWYVEQEVIIFLLRFSFSPSNKPNTFWLVSLAPSILICIFLLTFSFLQIFYFHFMLSSWVPTYWYVMTLFLREWVAQFLWGQTKECLFTKKDLLGLCWGHKHSWCFCLDKWCSQWLIFTVTSKRRHIEVRDLFQNEGLAYFKYASSRSAWSKTSRLWKLCTSGSLFLSLVLGNKIEPTNRITIHKK